MKITVIGAGYVGLTTGACFAEKGHTVFCCDNNQNKINNLKRGEVPFYEPGLADVVIKNIKLKKLNFTADLKTSIQASDVVFCCVWTPPDKDFKPNIKAVLDVAQKFGGYINSYKIFLLKSTVPVGTNEKCKAIIQNEIKRRGSKAKFDIVSNPEFLRQGSAVKDTMKPDRIIAGIENQAVKKSIKKIYKSFIAKDRPLLFTSLRSAELIKYAANAFLATKISFINEISNYCELKKCNIKEVEKGLKLDKRIGRDYLESGIGYGGNCLKKDIKGLIKSAEEEGFSFNLLKEVEEINEKQKLKPYLKVKKKLVNLKNKTIAVWGVAFKPNTDSVTNASSVKIVQKLLQDKAKVNIYDPKAADNFIELFGKNKDIIRSKTALEAAKNADALIVLTKWPEFSKINLKNLKAIIV